MTAPLASKDSKRPTSQSGFTHFANLVARISGRPISFGLATLIVLLWAGLGPIFHFSDTWQLVINTGTTIVTFLMVFLIQNAQFRDSEALHIKLDELIRAVDKADNSLLDLEELDEETLDAIRMIYRKAAVDARLKLDASKQDSE